MIKRRLTLAEKMQRAAALVVIRHEREMSMLRERLEKMQSEMDVLSYGDTIIAAPKNSAEAFHIMDEMRKAHDDDAFADKVIRAVWHK